MAVMKAAGLGNYAYLAVGADMANKSITLGYAMQEPNRQRSIMSVDEACDQLAMSAALHKATHAALH
jgi:hypothetical protein